MSSQDNGVVVIASPGGAEDIDRGLDRHAVDSFQVQLDLVLVLEKSRSERVGDRQDRD